MKNSLGKGLDALFLDNSVDVQSTDGENIKTVPISEVEPNRDQPRKHFDSEALSNLAASIKEHGVLMPLLVSPIAGGRYQIIAGERRWRASRIAGLKEVPVIVRDIEDSNIIEIALIENLQREDLNPVEEAAGYKVLTDNYSMTQEKIAESVGKSRSVIANSLRLLSLPQDVLELLKKGDLTTGHARAILAISDSKRQSQIAQYAIEKDLTVRQVEKLVKEQPKQRQQKLPLFGVDYTKEYENSIKRTLGRKVKISGNGQKGIVEISFNGAEDFDLLLTQLGVTIE